MREAEKCCPGSYFGHGCNKMSESSSCAAVVGRQLEASCCFAQTQVTPSAQGASLPQAKQLPHNRSSVGKSELCGGRECSNLSVGASEIVQRCELTGGCPQK